jgi:hypothetical protein
MTMASDGGGIIDRSKVRSVHTRLQQTYAAEPRSALFRSSAHVRSLGGFLQEAEVGEPAHGTHFTLRQDLGEQQGGRNEAPAGLGYMLLGVGL